MVARQVEHRFGCSEEFGFCDVADDLGSADSSGQNEGAGAAAIFLIACSESHEPFAVRFENGQRTIAENDICNAIGIFF